MRHRLRLPVGGVEGVGVVVVIIVIGVIELDHIDIELLLGVEVNGLQHAGLTLGTFVAVTAEAMVCQLVILLGLHSLDRNVLAVNTGVQPAAAVQAQIAVHGKQDASGVGAGKNTTVFVGVDMYHIVQNRISRFTGQLEILHQTQAEAVFCFRLIGNGDLTAPGHQHPQVLFQFLGGKIDHMISTQLFDLQHNGILQNFTLGLS